GNASAVFEPGGHSTNEVLFVVVEYEFGINGNVDTARLWGNPSPSSFGLPYPPIETGSIIITGNNRIAQAADFFLLARTGATIWGGLFVSNLRVGTTWNYVTGGPDTMHASLSASNQAAKVVLNVTNGMPGGTNYLLSSTNLGPSLSNWTVL